jgi:hypothetical protein
MVHKSYMVQPSVERIKFPTEEIEFIVGQIIRLEKEGGHMYSNQIDTAMDTLNESLKLVCKPMIYFPKGNE